MISDGTGTERIFFRYRAFSKKAKMLDQKALCSRNPVRRRYFGCREILFLPRRRISLGNVIPAVK
jgi:hypothetical protein